MLRHRDGCSHHPGYHVIPNEWHKAGGFEPASQGTARRAGEMDPFAMGDRAGRLADDEHPRGPRGRGDGTSLGKQPRILTAAAGGHP